VGNSGGVEALALQTHGRPYCLPATLPPLGAVFFISEQPHLPEKEQTTDGEEAATAYPTPIPTPSSDPRSEASKDESAG
jgi:1,4-alpha-glucan branching enzyme